jgi:hypothetical protein
VDNGAASKKVNVEKPLTHYFYVLMGKQFGIVALWPHTAPME